MTEVRVTADPAAAAAALGPVRGRLNEIPALSSRDLLRRFAAGAGAIRIASPPEADHRVRILERC